MRKKILAFVFAAALMLAWGYGGAGQVQAGGPAATVDYSIGVVADGCKTGTGETTCDVGEGSLFTVSVFIDAYDTSTGKYDAIQARLNESAGLTYQNRASVGEIVGVWPDGATGICADVETNLPGSYRVACVVGIGQPASTATGVVMEVDYKCSSGSQTVTLVHGDPSDTFLQDEDGNRAVDPGSDEVLTINCVPEFLPTPTPTITLDPPTATNEVGTDHTVTATVGIEGLGSPPGEGDADVEFEITAGPNTGDTGTDTTDADGETTFTYTGDGGTGTDTIQACVVDFPEVCDNATKDWVAATPTPTTTPTPTPTVAAAVQLPATGGTPSDGGSSALPWLVAIAGSLALMGAGSGLWLAYQRRRVR